MVSWVKGHGRSSVLDGVVDDWRLRKLSILLGIDVLSVNQLDLPILVDNSTAFFDEALNDLSSLVVVLLLLLHCVKSSGELLNLLSLSVNALLSEPLLFLGSFHLSLGSSSLGPNLELVDSGTSPLYKIIRQSVVQINKFLRLIALFALMQAATSGSMLMKFS